MEMKPRAVYTAEGIVIDADEEEPIVGAVVSSSVETVETDEDGYFRVRLPTLPKKKAITITADGYDEYTTTVGRRRLHHYLGRIELEYSPH